MRALYSELLRMSGWSLLIYTLLFAVLWVVEQCCPELSGTLLRWQEPAFLVGIPASILGTAYVLTIRNPRNYLGFYPGIVMSLLLSLQFYLRGSYDLMVLYLAVFIPFQMKALLTWRHDTHQSAEASPIRPTFLSVKTSIITRLISLSIILGDYALATYIIHHHQWTDQWEIKLCGAITIASAILANYWMIYKKNDAWFYWIYYCLSSIVMFVMIGNIFSIVLFTVMLVVNMTAQFAWLRMTRTETK